MLAKGLFAAMAAAFALVFGNPAIGADDGLWDLLGEGRAVAIMRHALASGTGDPPEFRVDDCSTQRNLSDEGRDQASAIGARFRANGIEAATVLSSQWCRCLETARSLGLGSVEALPALNSFFRDRTKASERTAALETFLIDWEGTRPLVLVTHQVNITSLTGVSPTSGEIVVVKLSMGGDAEVLGTRSGFWRSALPPSKH